MNIVWKGTLIRYRLLEKICTRKQNIGDKTNK